MSNQAVVITDPQDMEAIARFTARQSMQIWVESGGKMMLTRIASPAYIAKRFNLIDPRSKKLCKTAKQCLRALDILVKADEKRVAERKILATTGTTASPGTPN